MNLSVTRSVKMLGEATPDYYSLFGNVIAITTAEVLLLCEAGATVLDTPADHKDRRQVYSYTHEGVRKTYLWLAGFRSEKKTDPLPVPVPQPTFT